MTAANTAIRAERFWYWFIASLIVIAVLAGVVVTLDTAPVLARFDGIAYAPRVTSVRIVRELAPIVGPSAVGIALVAWASSLEPGAVARHLQRVLGYAVGAAIAALPAAALLALLASSVSLLAYGVRLDDSVAAIGSTLIAEDAIVGVVCALLDAALVCAVAWLGLDRFSRLRWPLSGKIVAVWAGVTVVGAGIALGVTQAANAIT